MRGDETRRVLVAITGASGSIYGVRLLELLGPLENVETHLILSKAGRVTMAAEMERAAGEIEALADVVHAIGQVRDGHLRIAALRAAHALGILQGSASRE